MNDVAGDAHAFLIVRLGALGDLVHTIPAAAALRAAYPAARIDWLVDARHGEILDLVTCIDRVIVVESPTIAGWIRATRELRSGHYSAALDFQGLMKSAVLARASGAKKVLGFSMWHLREKGARSFYTESVEVAAGVDGEPHVIHKNLRLLRGLGITAPPDGCTLRWQPPPQPELAHRAARMEGGQLCIYIKVAPGTRGEREFSTADRALGQ